VKSPFQELHDSIKSAKTPDDLTRPLARYYRIADENAATLIEEKGIQRDCHHGCSFCCFQRVNANAHEVFLILRFVNERFSQQERAELVSRLADYSRRCSAMTIDERNEQAIRCPFLVDGRCSIYSVRPLVCRAYHSNSQHLCETHCGSISSLQDSEASISHDLFNLWEKMGFFAHRAYELEGYDMTDHDLCIAFYAAISKPQLQKRWRKKQSCLLNVLP